MRIAVISDLHIGDERFYKNVNGFTDFLDHLEKHHDEIILLGDIVETYFRVYPWGTASYYLKLLNEFNAITYRFRSPPYFLLSGNHDAVAWRRWNIPCSISKNVDGIRIYFAHGHDLDWAYRRIIRTRLVEFYMWFSYRLKLIGFPQFYDYGYKVDYYNNVKNDGIIYIEKARELIANDLYDIVIMGHTHHETYIEFSNGGLYINSGDCLSRKMYISLDTGNKEYSLVYWKNGRIIETRSKPERTLNITRNV